MPKEGVAVTPKKRYLLAMSNYQCPKCGGTDFFMSKRNVVTGIGGIYGNRGGVKEFPVCRVCDEIMDKVPETSQELLSSPMTWVGLFSIIFIIWTLISLF
jgi:hypothetical protein